jgi:hypothetical protein
MCGRFLNKLPVAEMARIFGTRNAVRGISIALESGGRWPWKA